MYDEALNLPESEREEAVEPGYLESAMSARKYVGESIGQPLTADFLETVNRLTTAHREETEDYHRGYRTEADTESHVPFDAGSEFDQANPPMAALDQINRGFASVKTDDGWSDLASMPEYTGAEDSILLHFLPKRSSTLRSEVQSIFDRHQHRMATLRSKSAKRKLIASTHRKLENLHPFLDANTRTNRLVLHKMMVEAGLSPVILDNPLDVHLKTDQEWAGELERGEAGWKELRKQRRR